MTALRQKAAKQLGPQTVVATPVKDDLRQTSANQPTPTLGTPAAPRRAVDLNLPFGGGALDPISVGLALGLGGLVVAARRKRRRPRP